jgi:hypothetical protein
MNRSVELIPQFGLLSNPEYDEKLLTDLTSMRVAYG